MKFGNRESWRWSVLSMFLVVAVILSACGATEAPPEPTSPPAEEPTAAPTEPPPAAAEQVLNVGLYREMRGLDPAAYEGEPETMATTMMFDRLVCIANDKQYYPYLAESWEISDDGTVWTFHLRDDVVFHDGTKFDAEAVKFQFDRAVDPATKSQKAASLLEPYVSSEVIDPVTIKVTLAQPYAPFLDVLSSGYMGIPSPTAVREWGAEFEDHLVGSGPFKFVEWKRQNYLILEKNPDYAWGPPCAENQGPPYLDKLVFKFLPEVETKEALMDRGEEVNVVVLPSPAGLERWSAQPDQFTVVGMLSPGTIDHNPMNNQKPPTDELEVRQAIIYAVNREAIVNAVLKGIAEPAHNILSGTTLHFNPDAGSQYTYDPEKAKELLESAGWVDSDGDGVREKDGRLLEVDIHQRAQQVKDLYKELVCADLEAVGFGCTIVEGSQEQRTEMGMAGTLNMVGLSVEGFDPAYLTLLYHSRNIDGFNFAKVSDPELDALLDKADTSIEPEERAEALYAVQELIMDKAYILPIYAQYFYWVSHANVKGLQPDANGWYPYFQDVSIEQ
jgi:peptide/nickel transport system substrate-binding protein